MDVKKKLKQMLRIKREQPQERSGFICKHCSKPNNDFHCDCSGRQFELQKEGIKMQRARDKHPSIK